MSEENENRTMEIRRSSGTLVSMNPDDAEGTWLICSKLAKSGLVPSCYQGHPENLFAAALYGRTQGFDIMTSATNIYVVNCRPAMYGQIVIGKIRASGLCEMLTPPVYTGEGMTLSVTVTGQRKGDAKPVSYSYNMADAKLAGHLEKDTYKKNPKDMLFWRAFHRLANFLWADVLKGITIVEVAEDIPMEEVGTVIIEGPKKIEAPAPEKTAANTPAPEKTEEPKKRGPGRPPTIKEPVEASPATPPSPASEALADIPGETELEAPATEEATATTLTRVFGTLMGCVKLAMPTAYPGDHAKAGQPHPDAGKFIGYAVRVQTKEGEQKFLVGNYDEAVKMGDLKNKTVELFTEPLTEAIVNVVGKVVKYGAVNP